MIRDSNSGVMPRRMLGAVATSVLVAAMLAGCAAAVPVVAPSGDSSDAPSETFKPIGGVVEEYDSATQVYLLPDGYTYPPAPFSDASGSYQEGYGTSAAVNLWNCAWGKTYLDAQGTDPAAADAALVQFAAVTETETYKRFYDPVSAHPLFEQAIEDAQLGDPSTIQSIVAGSCSQ